MGEATSWVAIRGLDRAEIAERLDCADTGERADHRAEFALGQTPGGWLVVVFRRFDFVTPKRLSDLSKGAELLACKIEEHVMFSAAYGFRDGQQVWSIAHDPNKDGIYGLVIEGAPPREWDAIYARLKGQQDAEGGDEADVDFMFDAAPDLVAALSGYKHDGETSVAFTQLRPVRRGLLQSLFGRR